MRHIRKRKTSKEKNQRYHAKVRALQHFAIQLTNLDLQKMAELYRHSPTTRFLCRCTNRVSKAIVVYNGVAYPIVYDKKRHQIITILKPEYLNKRERAIYDACSIGQVPSARVVECVIPSPVGNLNIEIDTDDDAVNDDLKYNEEVKDMRNDLDQDDGLIVVPSEEEGRAVMEEAMQKINF